MFYNFLIKIINLIFLIILLILCKNINFFNNKLFDTFNHKFNGNKLTIKITKIIILTILIMKMIL